MLIGITGYARHGKDSIANLLVEKFGFTKLGFADAVREMAVAIDPYVSCGANRHFTEGDGAFARYSDTLRSVGYETAKSYADVRRLLQRIGTEGGRDVLGPDVWVNAMIAKIGARSQGLPIETNIVINDVRFENEAKMVKDFGGYLIRVTRPNFDNGLPPLHASESTIATLNADYDISAEGFDDLLVEAEHAYQHLRDFDNARQFARQFGQFEEDYLGARIEEKPKVYLAAPWVHKADAAIAKQRLIGAGIEVVSGWTERENTPQEVEPTIMSEQAILDRDEVREANTLVILATATSEGKASELGMALALGKRVILVKSDRVGNIFYHLPEVERVNNLEEAIWLLTGPDFMKNTTAVPFEPTGGVERTLDPVTGQPLPGTPWDGLPVAQVNDFTGTVFSANGVTKPNPQGVIIETPDSDIEHDLARHAGESGKD